MHIYQRRQPKTTTYYQYSVPKLLEGVGGVGHELADKDLGLGVQTLGHNVQQTLGLSLECMHVLVVAAG